MVPAAPVPQVCPPARAPRSRAGRQLERAIAPLVWVVALFGVLVAFLASRLNMPGVIVQTGSRPGPSDVGISPGATYMVVGITERGDATQVSEVRSIADYVDKFGDRVSYGALYDDLNVFFGEGGTRALVTRVVGGAATLGTLSLSDRAGSPIATLRVDALNAGAWSTRVSIAVADGAIANTFTITVLYDTVPVEVYPTLANPAAAVSAMGSSSYVKVTNLSSVSAAPTNNPAVLAATALSAGSDDRGSVVAATYTGALARFGPEWGWGIMAIPGQLSSGVGQAMLTHCRTFGRLMLVAPAAAQTPAQAKTATVEFLTAAGSEFGGLVYPWIKVDDGAGGTRTISPEGYTAACRARAHRQAGPWLAPAGTKARARTLVGVERVLTRDEINDLNANHVIPIAIIAGAVELYGWRSLSTDTRNYRELTGRDVMNEVAGLGSGRLEDYVFGTVDPHGHLFQALEAEMRAILEPMLNAGGLYEKVDDSGNVISPAYRIDTGPSVNTDAVLADDEVIVDVALRTSPTSELIVLRITKVAFDSNAL